MVNIEGEGGLLDTLPAWQLIRWDEWFKYKAQLQNTGSGGTATRVSSNAPSTAKPTGLKALLSKRLNPSDMDARQMFDNIVRSGAGKELN